MRARRTSPTRACELLADRIIESQEREIAEMTLLIDELTRQ